MLDASQNARIKELVDLIEKEKNSERFSKLIAELNTLLGDEKKPVKPSE